MKHYSSHTPSRRNMTGIDYSGLSKVRPYKKLTKKLHANSGRNNMGRITVRHQGGGNKKLYRMIDFKQVLGSSKVLTLEYDPYRTSFIALVEREGGAKAYVLAPAGVKVGDTLLTADVAPFTPGNRMKMINIPVGMQVFNVELEPGKGGQLIRTAGSFGEILANSGKYTDVKLPSGEVRRVPADGFATIGSLSNSEWNLVNIGKAGRSRWLGIRPTVRGSAMNPVDHPYGGGEGRQPRGTKKPKSFSGKVVGVKTRGRKKASTKFIVKRRK